MLTLVENDMTNKRMDLSHSKETRIMYNKSHKAT